MGRVEHKRAGMFLAGALLVGFTAVAAPAVGASAAAGVRTSEGSLASASAAVAPAATPARAGTPASIAVLGDSISAATGTGQLSAEQKQNSWVTGSVSWSMRGQLGIATAAAYNQASNGRRMVDMAGQAASLPTSTQFVVVELGGNDLCRPTVGEMTSTASYRAQFRSGLAAIRARVPDALVFVASIPDIYNLWFLRGAPSSVNPYVSDQVHQEDAARFFWDNFLDIEVPCQSLLHNPESLAAADVARRDQVRARDLAFNAILREECSAVLRCRYDNDLFFNFSSNRTNPPNGPLLPRNQWGFEDRDISNNHKTGSIDWSFLCPANFTYDGCGDHFHPSLIGQQKLAGAGVLASYQWAGDSTPPSVTLTPDRVPDGAGAYASSVTVGVSGADAAGVRGYEVRVHQPGGTVGSWQEFVGPAPDVTVSTTGQTYVEARALDVNGNLSASTVLGVDVEPAAFGTLSGTVVDRDNHPLEAITVSRHASGVEGALGTVTTAEDGTYDFGAVLTGTYKLHLTSPAGTHAGEWFDDVSTHAAATQVVVAAQADVVADAVLAPVGLTGTVTEDGSGDPVTGAWVFALRRGDHSFAAGASTDAVGSYELGLAPGTYEVMVVDRSGHHGTEWFNDRSGQGGADPVVVTAGQVTTLDAALAPAGRTGSIAGTVTDEVSGQPVTGAMAFAVTTGGVPSGGALADATGRFTIQSLPAGSYHVIVFDRSGSHHVEFYDDAQGFDDALTVTVAAGSVSTADAALAPATGPMGGAVVRGRLTDSSSGAPIVGGVAIALRATDFGFAAAAVTDAQGDYVIDVDAGSYKVEVIDPSFLHAMEWHDNLAYHRIADALSVAAPAGAPATVDAALDPAGPSAAIAGSVEAPAATPAVGAWVLAIGTDGVPAGGAVVGADGTYVIDGLVTGSYLLVFVEPTGTLAVQFFDDAAGPAGAALVTATAGHVTPADAVLAPAP